MSTEKAVGIESNPLKTIPPKDSPENVEFIRIECNPPATKNAGKVEGIKTIHPKNYTENVEYTSVATKGLLMEIQDHSK